MTPLTTSVTVIDASITLLRQVSDPAVRALALAAAAGLGLAAFRVRNTPARLFTWTAVLYASLVMPFLGWLLPPLSFSAPAFLRAETLSGDRSMPQIPSRQNNPLKRSPYSHTATAAARKTTLSSASVSPANNRVQTENAQLVQAHSTDSIPRFSSIPWALMMAGVYLAGVLYLLLRVFAGLVFTNRLTKAAKRIHEPRLSSRLALRARASRLTFVPDAAESEVISVPVTVGAWRSTILLPSGWREWDDAKLDAVVAHEVSHVARRDALTQRLSLLHRAIFWFSPLAWWLDRHLASLAEIASDEAALSSGAECNAYARTLLGFFEALQTAPGRVRWQGVSMAKAGQAEQRVERILAWKGAVTMGFRKSIAAALVTLAVPVLYVAASARPALHAADPQHIPLPPYQNQTAPTPTPSAPAVAPSPEMESVPEPSQAPGPRFAPRARAGVVRPLAGVPRVAGVLAPAAPDRVPRIAPMIPRVAQIPLPPTAWRQSEGSGSSTSGSSSGDDFSYSYGSDDQERFVIASGKSDRFTMSGSDMDAKHVEKLKRAIAGDFIWFQRDEKSYIVRDPATIDRAKKLWAPQEELGRKQEELGKQQEALGKQQEELGSRMERVQVKVPDITAELDRLRAKLQKLGSTATIDQIADVQSEIGELQSKLGEIQSQAGEEQSKFGEQQGLLGEQQGKLGEEQGLLGEQQGELAEQATRQMKQLLDEALAKGLAQPEKD
jgi:beta-lactamase regulating signal transducer with metallopeptidase domain